MEKETEKEKGKQIRYSSMIHGLHQLPSSPNPLLGGISFVWGTNIRFMTRLRVKS